MISASGYGIFLVVGIYAATLFGVFKLLPQDTSRMAQVIAIIITVFAATVVNYFLARFLNRHGCKHTVWGGKLQNVVLFLGAFLLFLAFFMLYGELKG